MGLRKDFKDVCVVNDACEIEYVHVFNPDFLALNRMKLLEKVFCRYMQISTKPTVPL